MNNQKKQELQRLLWTANVHEFYPDKPAVELEAGYQRWQQHRDYFGTLYKDFQFDETESATWREKLRGLKSGILYTFHFGPYRLLPRYLLGAGYHLTILVSSTVLERENAHYAQCVAEMGLPTECLECLDASNKLVLRRIIQAIAEDRIVLVFLDANESQAKNETKDLDGRLRVVFGNSYFYWRSNLFRLAERFALSMQAIYLTPNRENGQNKWLLSEITTVLAGDDKDDILAPIAAFAKLQHIFQTMMAQDWTAWENWILMHHYRKFDKRLFINATMQGSLMFLFSLKDKSYLFCVSSKTFYEISVKGGNIC